MKGENMILVVIGLCIINTAISVTLIKQNPIYLYCSIAWAAAWIGWAKALDLNDKMRRP